MLEDEPTGGGPADQPIPAADTQTESTTPPAAAGQAPGGEAPAGQPAGGQAPGAETAKKAAKRAPRKAAAKKAPATKAPGRKAAAKKAVPEAAEPVGQGDALGAAEPAHPASVDQGVQEPAPAGAPAAKKAAKRTPRKTAAKRAQPAEPAATEPTAGPTAEPTDADSQQSPVPPPTVAFLAPEPVPLPAPQAPIGALEAAAAEEPAPHEPSAEEDTDGTGAERRRRRRGRRGRGRNRGEAETAETAETAEEAGAAASGGQAPTAAPAEEAENAPAAQGDTTRQEQDEEEDREASSTSRRRRRRRRRGGEVEAETGPDDPADTVVRVRDSRRADQDDIQGVKGSTRIEAKRQRRREGREQGRRRPPIITEAEFLARREAVNRVMVVRQNNDRTQIAVLEDDVLVEHYVTKASATSYAGNVYLGRVQNVLPSMEAAFVDIGKGRNAVLYAGEVNWDAAGMNGKPRKIEDALKPGHSVLVQVTKDPIAHKGARLTSQVSLPGRFLVYVPEGAMTGISRKLPDTERKRLKDVLKRVVPEDAGVIVRTAAEGASEEDLARDVRRLQAQWEVISKKASASATSAPALLYAEPDLAIRVVRDVFNEDFAQLVVQGNDAWETLQAYVDHVAPDLADRLVKHTGETDVFADLRVDEQLMKALDRRVWLPSGGSLVIDRTEAMTVIDVNTGKFTGQGGNLEETVTRNNLEAAEEIVRQLRLRDIGGMIVVDFIDMVLESNRDLVLRRLTECLGRDRTKHQVAEVTSLGLVQMTRKRVGQGLLEAFSETCEACNGRGVIVHTEPVADDAGGRGAHSGDGRRKRGRGGDSADGGRSTRSAKPRPPAGKRAAEAGDAAEPAEPEAAPDLAADAAPDTAADMAPGAEPGSDPAEGIEPGTAEPEDVAGAAARAAGVPVEKVENSASASEEPEVEPAPVRRRARRRAASRPPGPPVGVSG